MARLLSALLVGLTAGLSSFALTADLSADEPAPAAAPPSPAPPSPAPPSPAPPPPAAGPLPPPGAAQPPPPPMERRSSEMMIGGAALTAAGGLAFLIGSGVFLLYFNDPQCSPCPMEGYCPPCTHAKERTIGIAIGVAGAVGLGVGIPLTIYGARKVPAESRYSADLVIGPGCLSLQGRF